MPSPTKINDSQSQQQQQGALFPDNLDTATLDARIEELTRRRTEMAAAATGPSAPSAGDVSNIAGSAGAAAQAFVDRFASGMMDTGGSHRANPDFGSKLDKGFDMMCGMAGGPGAEMFSNNMKGNDIQNMGMGYMNQGMMMQGGMPMNFDRRNSQMSMSSAMEGQQQAFQNWQQTQQMNPYFQMQRMGMMRDFSNGGMNSMMMMQNGAPSGFNPMMGMQSMMQQQQIQPGTDSLNPTPAPAAQPKKAKSKPKKRAAATELEVTPELVEASKGPFKTLDKGIPLALDEDKEWLTPLHCFVRRNCVEAFTATSADVDAPSKGKRKPIQIGQVGIRCPHCFLPNSSKDDEGTDVSRERGSVYYPTSLSSIYNATMNLLQRHINTCPRIPKSVMEKYAILKLDDARSGTSKKYWVESAKSIGFIDTLKGIRLSPNAPPSLSAALFTGEEERKKDEEKDGDDKENGDEKKSSNAASEFFNKSKESDMEAVPLVLPSDKENSTTFSYLLLSQMQPCVFTEADRLGKRKGLPTGFAGLACRHCFGGYGSGRFFPSSIKTLSDTSKTLNVLHNHMVRCRKCPPEVVEQLTRAKENHEDERASMKFGSQKAFFAKIWARLHDNRPYDPVAVRASQTKKNVPGDGSMPSSNQPRTLQFPPGMSGQGMPFMTGRMPGMMGGQQGQMAGMMGGQQGQIPVLPGGSNGQMGPQGGQMPPGMMGMNPMGMGGMISPEMMMRGYQDQLMNGGFNSMAQFGRDGGGMPRTGDKRSAEDDQMELNKRVRKI